MRYETNAYAGYALAARPGSLTGDLDDRYPALERVVGVRVGDDAKAYPFSVLMSERVVNDAIGTTPFVVLWGAPDTADAFSAESVENSKGVGTGVAFSRVVDGQVLSFSAVDDHTFLDRETGTTWSILGRALDGPLVGARLSPVIHLNEFWFAWAAFNQGAQVYAGP